MPTDKPRSTRLGIRLADLELERQVAAGSLLMVGAAPVIPAGLLKHLQAVEHQDAGAMETARIEQLAMGAVMSTCGATVYQEPWM